MWFSEEEVASIVESVWLATLDAQVHRIGDLPHSTDQPHTLTGCINIIGAWEGQVVLQVPLEMAKQAATKMLTLADAEPAVADLQDATGELTNMVGGNVKALLPQPSRLSLPSVVEGHDYHLRVPGAVCVSRMVFESGGNPFVVTMHARDQQSVPSLP